MLLIFKVVINDLKFSFHGLVLLLIFSLIFNLSNEVLQDIQIDINKMDVIKVVVVGDAHTGKSSLVKAFMELDMGDSFPQQK